MVSKLIGNVKTIVAKWFIQKTDIQTTFDETPSDVKVPSEKLVKESLEQKAPNQLATAEQNGMMSSGDFNKLAGIDEEATKTIIVDNLTTQNASQALSANQGYALNQKITALQEGELQIEVVESLPETGLATKIYLVSNENEEDSNSYDEYIYTNNSWEIIGVRTVDVSNKISATDLKNLISLEIADNGDMSLVFNDGEEEGSA